MAPETARVVAAACAAVLLATAAGCGGDGGENAEERAATAEDCRRLAQFQEDFNAAVADSSQHTEEDVQAALALARNAPAEIRDDLVIIGVYAELVRTFIAYEAAAGRAERDRAWRRFEAVIAGINGKEVVEADENIREWIHRNCD